MKCSLCGMVFTERDADPSCPGCAMSGGCGMLKCPNCGYETPKESGLVKLVRKWRKRRNDA